MCLRVCIHTYKTEENEEKNKLIADTKAALTAVKREKLAQAVEKKKADNAALLLQEAQQVHYTYSTSFCNRAFSSGVLGQLNVHRETMRR